MAETTSPTFPQAVASFEPTSTGVLLWTRLAGGATEAGWAIARDPSMEDVVERGVASTSPDVDHTITVSVDGLSPATSYWYQFEAGGERSPVGRTRTLPGRRRDGVPHRDRVLRRLRGGAAQRLPRRRRARGGSGAPPRRLHLREGGVARRPPSRPAACGDDARRLSATDRPGALGSRCAGPPPAPSGDHDLGRPRPGRQRLARRRQGARPRRARRLARPGRGRRPRPAGVAARPACPAGTIRSPRGGRSSSATWPSSCSSTRASRAATGRRATRGRRTWMIRSARSSVPSSAAGWPSGWPTTAGRGR